MNFEYIDIFVNFTQKKEQQQQQQKREELHLLYLGLILKNTFQMFFFMSKCFMLCRQQQKRR